MNKVIAFFAVAGALSVVGCGSESTSCTAPVSQGAPTKALPQNCVLKPDSDVAITVRLCPSCQDTSPSCNAEFLNNAFELDTAFQQCAENKSCALTSSCGVANSTVTCTVHTPSAPAQYQVIPTANAVQGGDNATGTVTVDASGSTSCSI